MADEPLKVLGRLVMARRLELKIERSKDLAAQVDVSTRVMSDIERGNRRAGDATYRKLEAALAWATGSVDAVLDHKGEPTIIAAEEAPDPDPPMTFADLALLGPRLANHDRQIDALWRRVEALEQQLQEGGGEDVEDPALDKTPAPGPADQPGLELLSEAARRNPKRPRRGPREQEAD